MRAARKSASWAHRFAVMKTTPASKARRTDKAKGKARSEVQATRCRSSVASSQLFTERHQAPCEQGQAEQDRHYKQVRHALTSPVSSLIERILPANASNRGQDRRGRCKKCVKNSVVTT